MGLDSVELVMRFEEKFNIRIPDPEASTIDTVENAADVIVRHIILKQPERNLFYEVLLRVNQACKALNFIEKDLSADDQLKDIIPQENLMQNWQQLSHITQLKLPALSAIDLGSKPATSFFNTLLRSGQSAFLENDVRRLVDCVCGLNYGQLVDIDNLTSRYEVLVVVMGLTYDQCGVEMNEIYPRSSFTNDLGID